MACELILSQDFTEEDQIACGDCTAVVKAGEIIRGMCYVEEPPKVPYGEPLPYDMLD